MDVGLASSVGHTPSAQTSRAARFGWATSQTRYTSGILTTSTRALGSPARSAFNATVACTSNSVVPVMSPSRLRQASLAPIRIAT